MKAKSILLLVGVMVALVIGLTSCDLLDNFFTETHEHAWEEATCLSPKTCSTCAETEGEALGHTEETVAGTSATCTETGITEGKICSVCTEIIVAQEEIPAAGHIFTDGVCVCGLIDNLFVGKTMVASSDTAGNFVNETWGYFPYTYMVDGDLATRYSSRQNGGKVEATIDLGAVYDLSDFKILLYDYPKSAFGNLGTGFMIQVLFGDTWTTVIDCTDAEFSEHLVITGDQNWVVFDLGGVNARKVKFTIPAQGSTGWTSIWELECTGKVSTAVEPEPEVPVLIDNVFEGKTFTPTEDATLSILAATWWKGGGYETLTDFIRNADNAPGRFSTVMSTSGMMDATIDLGGTYELHSLKFYTYDPAAGTSAGSVGADLLIQVYANGEWKDVIIRSDNASIMEHLVVSDGTYNDYLEFYLGGVEAEKVRFYISASASSSGTTFEEIECSGYAK